MDDQYYIKRAEELVKERDDIEIDREPVVSESIDGAYVAVWLWVPPPEEDR